MKNIQTANKTLSSAKNKGILHEYIKHADLVFLFLPGFILLIIFKFFPMGGITIAFKDYTIRNGIFGSPWVGLENFKALFAGMDFGNVLRNTLVISILKLVVSFPAPIILALLINELRGIKYKKIVQTFSYLPYFFSWVVLSGVITMVFSTRGPINNFISALGAKKPIEFFASGPWFIFMLAITHVWQSCGWNSVIYIATISGIDESLYEAARIDGAGKFRQALNITFPALIPTIVTVFILNVGSVMNAGFDQIYNLYNPAVYDVADILDTYVLRKMTSMDYSMATTAGLFKSVVSFILVVLSNVLVSKLSDDELGIW